MNKPLLIKDGYSLYIQYIKDKLDKYTNRLEDITKQKEYLFGVISSKTADYSKAGINIDELTYSNRAKFDLRTIKKYNFNAKDEVFLQSYIISYMNLLRSDHTCITSIKQYSMLSIPYEFYRYLFVELNLEYMKCILNGTKMDFGSGVGNISVKEKERYPGSNAIDWGKSNAYKEQLIADGKTPYNKETAPDGVKWHIPYSSMYSYWIWWKYRLNSSVNSIFYKFIPTKFINGNCRNREWFKKNFITKEQILDSNELGNIDKLYKLLDLDPIHALNYR